LSCRGRFFIGEHCLKTPTALPRVKSEDLELHKTFSGFFGAGRTKKPKRCTVPVGDEKQAVCFEWSVDHSYSEKQPWYFAPNTPTACRGDMDAKPVFIHCSLS